MKRITLLLLALSITSISFSQKKNNLLTYYKNDKGKIYNLQEYTDLKKQIVAEFGKMNRNVVVKEVFGESKQKGDSIIQNYNLKVYPVLNDGQIKETATTPEFGRHLIGKKLPQTTLENINGNKFNINELNGKPTMINFWFTSCKPCIDEFPVLNKIKEKYADKVNFISITYDDKSKVAKLTDRFSFDFDKFINALDYIEKLDIKAFPTSLFIDKNGIVKYAEGGVPFIIKDGKQTIDDGKEFKEILEELLKN
jgi:thiol-disulfide isomerase/thioredoxin